MSSRGSEDLGGGPGAGNRLAIVAGGGGARAAYQVGVLRSIARRHPDLRTPILCGVSAGAINIALLANHRANFAGRAERLAELWWDLRCEDVFAADALALLGRVLAIGTRMVVGYSRGRPVPGFVDTAPLRRFLSNALENKGGALRGVPRNLAEGSLEAVSFTTTRYATGQTVTFFAGRDVEAWERPHRRSVRAELSIDHVMASAALPLLFPAVRIGDEWYGDGGIRLVAPLAPALHLGAERILTISTRHARSEREANEPAFAGPPTPAHILGVLYNAVFLDHLDQDALTMERLNRLLRVTPREYHGDLRETRLLVLRPSQDLGRMAGRFEPELPPAFRFLTRRLGTRESKSPDLISNVMFQPDYLRELIRLGERDGDAAREEIDAFLGP